MKGKGQLIKNRIEINIKQIDIQRINEIFQKKIKKLKIFFSGNLKITKNTI